MRSRRTDFTHLSSPNAFSPEFLRRFGEEDQPPNTEAEVAGPWRLEACAEGWACLAEGAEAPAVAAREREVALLVAAALPPSGRPPRFALADGAEAPFVLLDRGKPAGSVAWWSQELVIALNLLDALLASPASLAYLLEAAGVDLLARVGRLLAARAAAPWGSGPAGSGQPRPSPVGSGAAASGPTGSSRSDAGRAGSEPTDSGSAGSGPEAGGEDRCAR